MSHAPNPNTWLDEYGDALFRYAMIRVRSEATAEDLVQETLLAAWQAFSQFNEQATVKTWLIGILKHKIVDYFRKQHHEMESLDDAVTDADDELLAHQFDENGHWRIELVDWGTPDQTMANEQFWQVFYHCLARLPQNMADLFILRTVDGLSSDACCKLLEIETTNQLCVALSRTRMKLRQCLELNWFEQG